MANLPEQEFLCGWTAGEQDDSNGNGERTSFPPYRSGAFIEGYTAFWDKQRADIDAAERDCIADYDARVSA